ncbi:hypothetical protein ACFLYJ_01255 [Candidatus Cloacimonadota bacterium]
MGKIVSLILTGFLLFACSQSNYKITGNIINRISLNQSGYLADILQESNIEAEYILVIAADGTAFFVSEASFSEIKIISEKGEFNSESSSLPPVSNLNNIIEICVYNSDFPVENYLTPFSKRMNNFKLIGENSKNGHHVRKYKLREDSK